MLPNLQKLVAFLQHEGKQTSRVEQTLSDIRQSAEDGCCVCKFCCAVLQVRAAGAHEVPRGRRC